MTVLERQDKEMRVEVKEPVPFEGERPRTLLIAAALAAPLGSSDPVDLALLSAASRQEELGRYEQLGYAVLDEGTRHSVARVRRVGSEVERLIARGDLQAILELCGRVEADCVLAKLPTRIKTVRGVREVAVATRTMGDAGDGKWRFLGYLPVRTVQQVSRREDAENSRHLAPCHRRGRALHWFILLIVLLTAAGIFVYGGRFLYDRSRTLASTPLSTSSASGK
ncbi:MAG TPA: hypothetical protein VJ550_07185 [Geomonas sp.]|nr:hypothetical protein [Geomonas sp.]